jgi:hypothetical protein
MRFAATPPAEAEAVLLSLTLLSTRHELYNSTQSN